MAGSDKPTHIQYILKHISLSARLIALLLPASLVITYHCFFKQNNTNNLLANMFIEKIVFLLLQLYVIFLDISHPPVLFYSFYIGGCLKK